MIKKKMPDKEEQTEKKQNETADNKDINDKKEPADMISARSTCDASNNSFASSSPSFEKLTNPPRGSNLNVKCVSLWRKSVHSLGLKGKTNGEFIDLDS